MRSIIAKAVLSSILLSFPALAFPRPQVGDNVDPSGTSDSSSLGPNAANPFPDDPGDAPASTTSAFAAATNVNDPGSAAAASGQNSGLVDGHVIATPLIVDTPSDDPPPQANKTSSGGNEAVLGHPGELTGTLLGMPNCSGIFYNPKWDSCDQATGKVTTKAEPNGKRQVSVRTPQRLSAFSRKSESRRQVIETSSNNAEHERDPSILSGVAGVDDGAEPRTTNTPGGSNDNTPRAVNNWNVPFGDPDNSGTSASGSGSTNSNGAAPQTESDMSPGNNNFWNTPFEAPQSQGSEQAQSGSKVKRQERSPGNINSWNVPFELPQGEGQQQTQNEGKQRRQSSGTTDLRLESGPLSGEDRDLDGAIPYMQVDPPKVKRQSEDSPHVEVGPPGPGGARNIIINRRRNQPAETGSTGSGNSNEDRTGYLGALGRSGSGLNLEDPSRDSTTPPREPGPRRKRAQPDFNYVRPVHAGSRGADIPRVAVVNSRQSNDSSSDTETTSNSDGGFLGQLGANEEAAARANAPVIPSHPGKREAPGKSKFDSVAPHRDGNHENNPSETIATA